MASGTITNTIKRKTVLSSTQFSSATSLRTIQNYASNKRYVIEIAIGGAGGGDSTKCIQEFFIGDTSRDITIHPIVGNGFLQYIWITIQSDGVVALNNSFKLLADGNEWVDMTGKYFWVWEIG